MTSACLTMYNSTCDTCHEECCHQIWTNWSWYENRTVEPAVQQRAQFVSVWITGQFRLSSAFTDFTPFSYLFILIGFVLSQSIVFSLICVVDETGRLSAW